MWRRVRVYWIPDPELRSLEVFELQPDGRYVRALAATEGLAVAVPGIDGATLDLDAAWLEVDELVRRFESQGP